MAVQARKGTRGWTYRALYRDKEGRQHSGKSFKTKKEAQHDYGRLKSEVNRGLYPWMPQVDVYSTTKRGSLTVAGWAEAWLPGHQIAAHTRDNYAAILKNHVLPELGSKVLSDVQLADIRRWFRRLEDEGKSGALRKKIKAVSQAAFQAAVEDGKLAWNPMRDVKIKTEAPPRRKAMTRAEFESLLEATPEHYRLLLRTIVSTGARFEEAIALRAEDIDGQTVFIRRTVQRLARGSEVKNCTKNGKSREVKITQALSAEIRLAANHDGWIFTEPDGGFISRNFRRNVWLPAMKKAGLEGFAPRDLRRTHATWLRQGGASLEVVRDQLGHSNVAITDTYLGENRDAQDAALAAFQLATA